VQRDAVLALGRLGEVVPAEDVEDRQRLVAHQQLGPHGAALLAGDAPVLAGQVDHEAVVEEQRRARQVPAVADQRRPRQAVALAHGHDLFGRQSARAQVVGHLRPRVAAPQRAVEADDADQAGPGREQQQRGEGQPAPARRGGALRQRVDRERRQQREQRHVRDAVAHGLAAGDHEHRQQQQQADDQHPRRPAAPPGEQRTEQGQHERDLAEPRAEGVAQVVPAQRAERVVLGTHPDRLLLEGQRLAELVEGEDHLRREDHEGRSRGQRRRHQILAQGAPERPARAAGIRAPRRAEHRRQHAQRDHAARILRRRGQARPHAGRQRVRARRRFVEPQAGVDGEHDPQRHERVERAEVRLAGGEVADREQGRRDQPAALAEQAPRQAPGHDQRRQAGEHRDPALNQVQVGGIALEVVQHALPAARVEPAPRPETAASASPNR
jgi:hypothetical protein